MFSSITSMFSSNESKYSENYVVVEEKTSSNMLRERLSSWGSIKSTESLYAEDIPENLPKRFSSWDSMNSVDSLDAEEIPELIPDMRLVKQFFVNARQLVAQANNQREVVEDDDAVSLCSTISIHIPEDESEDEFEDGEKRLFTRTGNSAIYLHQGKAISQPIENDLVLTDFEFESYIYPPYIKPKNSNSQSNKLLSGLSKTFEIKQELSDALKRNLCLQQKIVSKSKDVERAFIKSVKLESNLESTQNSLEQAHQEKEQLQRRVTVLRSQVNLSVEYQEKMQRKLSELSLYNQNILAENASLCGESDLSNMSLQELSLIEVKILEGLQKVREETASRMEEAIENERVMKQNKASNKCVVCLNNEINTMIQPCRHRVLCKRCAQKVKRCPVDRKMILDRISLL